MQMKTHTYRISVDTRKRILLETMASLASIGTLSQILSQLKLPYNLSLLLENLRSIYVDLPMK